MPIKNILLDRDGTLIEDKHYLADPSQVCILPGVVTGLTRFKQAGLNLFLVSNQSGVGRGYFAETDVQNCQQRLDELLLAQGLSLNDKIWCSHSPEAHCACRKPNIGMWQFLAAKHGLKAAETIMIGDKPEDVQFAQNAGLKPVLVLTGKGLQSAKNMGMNLPWGQQMWIWNKIIVVSDLAQLNLENLSELPS